MSNHLIERTAARTSPWIAAVTQDRASFFTFQQPTPADIEALSKLDAQREYELENFRFEPSLFSEASA